MTKENILKELPGFITQLDDIRDSINGWHESGESDDRSNAIEAVYKAVEEAIDEAEYLQDNAEDL